MPMEVRLTKIPQLNSVVIRQYGGHLFISAPNVVIIDKDGLLNLIAELGRIGFISNPELVRIQNEVFPMPKSRKHWEEQENDED